MQETTWKAPNRGGGELVEPLPEATLEDHNAHENEEGNGSPSDAVEDVKLKDGDGVKPPFDKQHVQEHPCSAHSEPYQ